MERFRFASIGDVYPMSNTPPREDDPPAPFAFYGLTEGGKIDLLDLELFPGLRECQILVEEHEVFFPGSVDILTVRFIPIHRIEVIPRMPRIPADLPVRWPLATRWLTRLNKQGRSRPQSWLCTTRRGAGQ